jgi:hypothetical protein
MLPGVSISYLRNLLTVELVPRRLIRRSGQPFISLPTFCRHGVGLVSVGHGYLDPWECIHGYRTRRKCNGVFFFPRRTICLFCKCTSRTGSFISSSDGYQNSRHHTFSCLENIHCLLNEHLFEFPLPPSRIGPLRFVLRAPVRILGKLDRTAFG